MALKASLQKLKTLKVESSNEIIDFNDVDELRIWLKLQMTKEKRNCPLFNFTGYVIGTNFDDSGLNKWARI